jgi:hypothetical protein
MSLFFYAQEIGEPEQVKAYLAEEYHWKEKYSAYELATSWINAGGIPPTVAQVLATCPDYCDAKLVEGLFERKVNLRTKGRDSQTDLLAFCIVPRGHAVIAVEGKVEEPFGPLVEEWRDLSEGKETRFKGLCTTLGLDPNACTKLRYQLFHRAASAIYEAQRYGVDRALLLVHSFSARQTSLPDFLAFADALGLKNLVSGKISGERVCDGVKLRLAWCADKCA